MVEKVLLHGMTTLNVRVVNSNLAADCQITRAARNKKEAHLITGWYGLCKELKLSHGNKLLLTFLPNEDELYILMRVVRNN